MAAAMSISATAFAINQQIDTAARAFFVLLIILILFLIIISGVIPPLIKGKSRSEEKFKV